MSSLSFNAILSSLGGPPRTAAKQEPPRGPAKNGLKNGLNHVEPAVAATAPKRKADGVDDGPPSKLVKAGQNGNPSRPVLNKPVSTANLKTSSAAVGSSPTAPYRGTAKASTTKNQTVPAPKPVQKPKQKLPSHDRPTATPSPTSTSDGLAKPSKKRGFAGIMEKAKTVQLADKAAGANISNIKHKTKPSMLMLERNRRCIEERLKREKRQKLAKAGVKPGATGVKVDRKGVGAPVGAGNGKTSHAVSKGTMGRQPEPLPYTGTMRAQARAKNQLSTKTSEPSQDSERGGYARWSDLDDAEEDHDYDSEASSDMEAGIADVEEEEAEALRAARRDDQEELEREEAHRREKAERKRKLEALASASKSKTRT